MGLGGHGPGVGRGVLLLGMTITGAAAVRAAPTAKTGNHSGNDAMITTSPAQTLPGCCPAGRV
jgi:hypothetical protein